MAKDPNDRLGSANEVTNRAKDILEVILRVAIAEQVVKLMLQRMVVPPSAAMNLVIPVAA